MAKESNPQSQDIFAQSTQAIEMAQNTLKSFLDTADVDRVYGKPIQQGDTTIIPAAEVLVGLGFGGGFGGGYAPGETEDTEGESIGAGGGAGGGGRTLSRPVAVIIASPQGVRVEPVVDPTKIALAALTAGGFMMAAFLRMVSPRRALKEMKD